MSEQDGAVRSLNLWQRMNLIMKDVSYVRKENKKVNNQYTYVSHDAVAAKIRPVMVEHGVVMMQEIVSQDIEHQKYMKFDKYDKVEKECLQICATIVMRYTFINIDNPEEKMSVDAIGIGIDPGDKASGKAMSYAKKYCLLQAFLLETGDDPERNPESQVANSSKENPLLTRFKAARVMYLKNPDNTDQSFNDAVEEIKSNNKDPQTQIKLIEELK